MAAEAAGFTPGRVRQALQFIEPSKLERLFEAFSHRSEIHSSRKEEGKPNLVRLPLPRWIPRCVHQFTAPEPVRSEKAQPNPKPGRPGP